MRRPRQENRRKMGGMLTCLAEDSFHDVTELSSVYVRQAECPYGDLVETNAYCLIVGRTVDRKLKSPPEEQALR